MNDSTSIATATNGDINPFDTGDNSWMLTSTVLVLLMTPALAFFYGGMVDRKNILNQLFLSFICMGIITVQWVLIGFSFAFGPPVSKGFGSFDWSVLRFGEVENIDYSPTYSLLTFCMYQCTFAIITPALISGSIVGRMKMIPYMIFIFIWTTVCYDPMAHWVWGSNGWLKTLGTLDFAGGTVVHILSGVSGFTASIILGKRHDYDPYSTSAHNLPFTILGTIMNDSTNIATATNGDINPFDTGDNSWMLTSTVLVLLMTPALAFFYGGMVDRKNILNQLFLSFICMGIITVQWVLIGFSFAFGPPVSKGFGSFGWSVLRFGEVENIDYSPTYSLLTFCMYQCTFAIITPALISGSIVGRMKMIPYMIFIFIWTTVCYDPMAHWVWGSNGWLKTLGTLDFAGGTVVHILSGVSGFTASIILGKRHDYDPYSTSAHNLPFTILGTCLLWVGWNGFNGGSAGSASDVAAMAVVNTNTAAASALVTWVVIDAIRGHISISGACTGSIVGLVSVTPACGFVQPGWALLIGIIGAAIVYCLLLLKRYMRFDDTLDVAIVHGCGGISGAFLTGLFAEKWVNPSGGANGAFYGHPIQLWYQIAGILTAIGFASVCTAGILLPLHFTIGIRLAHDDELTGLDIAAHGEKWEAAANRAAADLVQQMREKQEQDGNGVDYENDNGTFELSYKPANADAKPITIQYSALSALPPINFRNFSEDALPYAQLMCLDKMLLTVSIAGLERSADSSSSVVNANVVANINPESALEHEDYRAKWLQIRQLYHTELEEKNNHLLSIMNVPNDPERSWNDDEAHGYSLILRNCECLAYWCKTGRWYSEQVTQLVENISKYLLALMKGIFDSLVRAKIIPAIGQEIVSELLEKILPSCSSKFCTILSDGIGNGIAFIAVEMLKLAYRIYQLKHNQMTRQEFFDKTVASVVKSFTIGVFAFLIQAILTYMTFGTAMAVPWIGGLAGSMIGAVVGDILGRLVVNGVAQLSHAMLTD
ncbi:unnamed protein product [Rotaria sp. Silwood1]|nr:unnamed protein product [Rotaria sp. Silwood1]